MSISKKDPETAINNSLDKLFANSKGLVAKIPFDGLKLNRNLDQLYNILKKKNREAKPLHEESKARNIFALTQNGFETQAFQQKIVAEKYSLNLKREERELKKASQFFSALDTKNDISAYLSKYSDFMLYNLTDHAYVKGRDRTMKKGVMKIKKKWDEQVKSKTWNKSLPVNYKITSRSRFSVQRTNEELTGKKREYYKHFQNYVIDNYILKDPKRFHISRLVHNYINVNEEDPEVQDLWKIIWAQISCTEQPDFKPQNLEYCFEILTDTNCGYLEEEFANVLASNYRGNSNMQTEQYFGVKSQDLDFIYQEYLSNQEGSFIEYDRDVPVWAVVYLYFRSRRFNELKEFVRRYESERGKLKGDLKEFDKDLHIYFNNNMRVGEDFVNKNLFGPKAYEDDVFKRMLITIMAKHDKVPDERLLDRLQDYLWFNLKICRFQDEEPEENDGSRKLIGHTTLPDLQKTILDAGSSQFDANGTNPLNYIKMLFLVSAYDEALKYMEDFEELHEEAVHFAIVLQESGLLKLRKKYEEVQRVGFELLKPQDYHRMIIDYTSTFSKNNFMESVYYLKLILSSQFDPCSNDLVAKTISGFVIRNNQINKIFVDNQHLVRELKKVLGDSLFNDVILQITHHYRKELNVIFGLLESIRDYEGIFKIILEEEYKTYEKSKSEEIRKDGRAMTEINLKFKFLNDCLKTYRYNSKGMKSDTFELIDFVKVTREIYNALLSRDFENGFKLLKKLDDEKKIFGTDERRMQMDHLNKTEVEKNCYVDIILYGSKLIREYRSVVIENSQEKEEMKKNKRQAAEHYYSRLRNYYAKSNMANDVKQKGLVEALRNEIELR